MKKNLGVSMVVIGALCGTLQAQDAAQPKGSPQSSSAQGASQSQPAETHAAQQNQAPQLTTSGVDRAANGEALQNRPALGELEKARGLLGREVKSAQNERLGSVKDLAVDMKNGRILEVIVGSGGVLGFDQDCRAVPPSELTCDQATKTLTMNVDASRFNAAPSFKISDWDANSQKENIVAVYKYYSLTPYFVPQEAGAKVKVKEIQLGNVQRADKMLGTDVRNVSNDRIGTVQDMMVDLHDGRVAEVILASGGFLGLGDEYSAVPPQSFQMGAKPDELMLDATKESLMNAPHYNATEWAKATSPDQVGSVYRAYKIDPYFNVTAANNTAQNVRERNSATLTPLQQGTSQSDVETTRQIRKAVMAASNLSIDARNIKIITLNGHVTLRGSVKNLDEKRRIAEIAATVTPAANIDNQLQVESGPTASIQ